MGLSRLWAGEDRESAMRLCSAPSWGSLDIVGIICERNTALQQRARA